MDARAYHLRFTAGPFDALAHIMRAEYHADPVGQYPPTLTGTGAVVQFRSSRLQQEYLVFVRGNSATVFSFVEKISLTR